MCGLIVISVIHYVNVHVQYICCFYRELMKLHAYMTDKVCDWFQNIIFFSVMIKETFILTVNNTTFERKKNWLSDIIVSFSLLYSL